MTGNAYPLRLPFNCGIDPERDAVWGAAFEFGELFERALDCFLQKMGIVSFREV